MSLRQLAALALRHIFVVVLLLLVTARIAVYFKHTPVTYGETATVAVEPANFRSIGPLDINSDFLQDTSLLATCQLVVIHVSGPQGRAELQRAGVTGKFTASIVNNSNADDPSYTYPDLLVSVTGGDPDTTRQQLSAGIHVLAADLAGLQAGAHFSGQYRIGAYVLSDSGPVSLRGSSVRSYAALLFLGLVATFLACRFLDRRLSSRIQWNAAR
jgi:hypothetical protein